MAELANEIEILGAGIRFPFRFTSQGGVDFSVTDPLNLQHLKEGIIQRLFTSLGERVVEPGIGSNLNNAVFEPNDEFLESAVRRIAEASLIAEPRLESFSVTVTRPRADTLLLDIAFKPIGVNVEANLVFPFFLSAVGV